ncbi:hypothetical protein [Rubinisphaera sp.]|uniref:lipoate--protein ligase family protein n=1 Tax=Rubinisphaera sp. TaxID=2024857 RepID=UPI000C0FC946|nr:hypothetical protein [Rubinisphaera sp.]MBV09365.1 hypothetical protein [Rubinisphaera sp.]HCS51109.1 lipoate--protein ligase family protein [Planctomycetaceae bacterium]|tara:strand:- start:53 stop:727 length:675 start_codon:yes stop_codon:yes gene_type:complete
MTTAHLYNDLTPKSGRYNMTVDEWLLTQAIEQQQISLRFYRWEEPTLSLGYFQSRREFHPPPTLKDLPQVERLSGGGAILHDLELTYSIALPASHPISQDPTELYSVAHSAIIKALAEQQIEVAMRGEDQADRNDQFLCFLRGDRHDVLSGEYKILGSAQRRRKGAILQHGSLILGTSEFAPEIPGLQNLTNRQIDIEALTSSLFEKLKPLAADWQMATPVEFK